MVARVLGLLAALEVGTSKRTWDVGCVEGFISRGSGGNEARREVVAVD